VRLGGSVWGWWDPKGFFSSVRTSAQAFLSKSFGPFPYTKPESGSFSFVITRQEIHESPSTTRQISAIRLLLGPTLEGMPLPGHHYPRTGPFGVSGLLHRLPWIYGNLACPGMLLLLSIRFHYDWEHSLSRDATFLSVQFYNDRELSQAF
jgi:hypothetical protein